MLRGLSVTSLLAAAVLLIGAVPATARPAPDPPSETVAGLYSTTSMELILLERDRGPAVALRELSRRIKKNPRLAGVCHAIAHDLGHEALQAANGVAAEALAARDDVCGGGYTHGIIEMALATSKHPARDLLTICAPSQDGSCFHGVGHGLMFATKMNVDRSLDLCGRSPNSTLAGRCAEGVFMQLFSADDGAAHVGGVGAAGRMTPALARAQCEGTRQAYAANCWFYAPTVWLAGQPDDFTGVMGWCGEAPNAPGRQSCAKGVGSRTVKYHPDDLSIGAAVCAAAGALTDPCLSGMGSYWSVHHEGRRLPSDVCHRLQNEGLERRCLAVT
jgi:hypothetical protein